MADRHCRSQRLIYMVVVAFSAAGRNAYFIIAAWIVFDVSKSASMVAVLLGLGSASELLTTNLGGAFADRFNRRLVCLVCDVFRTIIVGLTGLLMHLHEPLPVLFALWSLYSVADRAYLTALQAVIPSITAREHLVGFNSLSYMAMQSSNFVSAFAAGFALQALPRAFSPTLPLLCFMLSLCFMTSLYRSSKQDYSSGNPVQDRRFHAADMLPTRLPKVGLWVPTCVYSVIYATGMLVNVMGPAFIERDLFGPALQYGYLEAAWALGSVFGCCYLFIFAIKQPKLGMVLAMGISGATLCAFLYAQNLPVALIQMTILGACYNLSRVLVDVEVQHNVVDDQLGRARSQVHTFCVAMGIVLYGIVAVAGDRVFPSTIFGSFGLFTLIAIIGIGIFLRNRGGRQHVGPPRYGQ